MKKKLNKSKPRVKVVKLKKKSVKPKSRNKIKVVMEEFKEDKLHSGSDKGPTVTNPRQALAIAISEQKRKKRK